MKSKLSYLVASLALAGLVFAGCHSSSGGNNSGTTGTTGNNNNNGGTALSTIVAIGAMAKGSVKVNGVEFSTSPSTTITADNNPQPETILANGKTVKVKGTVNADGVTGTAEKVEVVSEVRGPISAPPGTDTVTVHGQTVLIDGGTLLAGGATGISSLAQDDNVEVHGGRDDTGVIHATRVEKLAAGPVENEVRGAVSGKAATSFNIGSLPVTFTAGTTTMVPPTATFADIVDGAVVQVRLGNGNVATQITVEDLNHPEFEPVEGQEFSVEGILKGFSATGAFAVGTQQVQLGTGAGIDGGVLADLVDGMKVEAEGHNVANGVLTAGKITIKDSVRIETNAEANGSADVLGKTVTFTSGTRPDGLASGGTITAGNGLRIRGFISLDGSTITATRIDNISQVGQNRIIIQGPVKNISASSFTIIDITVSTDATTVARPNDDTGSETLTMPLAYFFSALTADKTIVKARGTFSGGTLTATEVELE